MPILLSLPTALAQIILSFVGLNDLRSLSLCAHRGVKLVRERLSAANSVKLPPWRGNDSRLHQEFLIRLTNSVPNCLELDFGYGCQISAWCYSFILKQACPVIERIKLSSSPLSSQAFTTLFSTKTLRQIEFHDVPLQPGVVELMPICGALDTLVFLDTLLSKDELNMFLSKLPNLTVLEIGGTFRWSQQETYAVGTMCLSPRLTRLRLRAVYINNDSMCRVSDFQDQLTEFAYIGSSHDSDTVEYSQQFTFECLTLLLLECKKLSTLYLSTLRMTGKLGDIISHASLTTLQLSNLDINDVEMKAILFCTSPFVTTERFPNLAYFEVRCSGSLTGRFYEAMAGTYKSLREISVDCFDMESRAIVAFLDGRESLEVLRLVDISTEIAKQIGDTCTKLYHLDITMRGGTSMEEFFLTLQDIFEKNPELRVAKISTDYDESLHGMTPKLTQEETQLFKDICERFWFVSIRHRLCVDIGDRTKLLSVSDRGVVRVKFRS